MRRNFKGTKEKEPVDHMEHGNIQRVMAAVRGGGDSIEVVYKLREVVFRNSPLLGSCIFHLYLKSIRCPHSF